MAVAVQSQSPRGRGAARIVEALQGYGFLLPAFLIVLTFQVLPVLYAGFVSLFDARIVSNLWAPGRWLGFDNYGGVLEDPDFRRSLINTVWYVVMTVPPAMFLSLLIGALLNTKIVGRDVYRTAYFVPYVTSTVSAALVWY